MRHSSLGQYEETAEDGRIYVSDSPGDWSERPTQSVCASLHVLRIRRKALYWHLAGKAMGSPVSVPVAEIVMQHIEKRVLVTLKQPPTSGFETSVTSSYLCQRPAWRLWSNITYQAVNSRTFLKIFQWHMFQMHSSTKVYGGMACVVRRRKPKTDLHTLVIVLLNWPQVSYSANKPHP